MDKWDKRFIELAKVISEYSKDKTKIGSVIVKDKRILSTGFNGFPSKIEDTLERLSNREQKLKYVIHSEMNAILHAGKHGISLEDSTLYIWGLNPCQECAKHIVVAGIKKVIYYVLPQKRENSSWQNHLEFVKNLFAEAEIDLIEYSISHDKL